MGTKDLPHEDDKLRNNACMMTSSHPPIWQRWLASPKHGLTLIALTCLALLGYGLYLQHVVGLEPCPMCIVQRYAMVLIMLLAAVLAWLAQPTARVWGLGLLVFLSGSGAFVAARQSWLQWFPPEVYTCGRDFYGMIETFPLKRAIPMIFRGSGDCTKIDWTFLGLSIANWSFLAFLAMGLFCAWLLWRQRQAQRLAS
jgi:protein dithiol:quinone oxidoreductase